MTKKDKKQLSTNYNIYGPENLEQKIDAEEIKALCPKVKTEAMYIIKDNTSKKNLEKVAALFQKAGYTEEDYWIDRAEITESMFDSQYESVEYRLLMNPDNPCTRTQSLQLAGLCDIINSRVYMIFQSGTPDEQKNDMIRKMILDKYTIDGIEYSVDIEEIDNVDESIKMSLAITVSEFE